MVDSILDNLSLRSQRRADLKLEVSLLTSSQQLDDLVNGVRKIVGRKEIENSAVFLNDITGNSFIIQSEYYTAPITIQDFNTLRQEITMQVLKLMEQLNIEIAGANTDVRITGNNQFK